MIYYEKVVGGFWIWKIGEYNLALVGKWCWKLHVYQGGYGTMF